MANYGTREGADIYHEERGNQVWLTFSDEQKDQALTRGSDYIDRMFRVEMPSGFWVSQFVGVKSVPARFREWPRNDVVDYSGFIYPDDTTPEEVEYATYEAALREAESPGSLFPDYTVTSEQGPVIQETVGPVTVKYSDLAKNVKGYEKRPPNMPIVPAIESTLAPFLKPISGAYGIGIMVV